MKPWMWLAVAGIGYYLFRKPAEPPTVVNEPNVVPPAGDEGSYEGEVPQVAEDIANVAEQVYETVFDYLP